MAIERRREEGGGGGRPLPEENGSLPAGEADPAAPVAPPAGGLPAEIQSLPLPTPPSGSCSPLLLDYDGSVLPFLGRLGGGHQKALIFLTWIPALFIGFSQFSDSFLLVHPISRCKGTDGKGNWSEFPPQPPPRGLTTSPSYNHSSSYSRGILAAPELPTPEGKNDSYCHCSERYHRIPAGLQQNIVSKIDGGEMEKFNCRGYSANHD
ncbi:PREDICTED: solute carrier family 22 member 23-like [Thamnophis sirtalis]|uniref:Solute carrier family 22 member 23-like n=1 Tax=Thamnophis sirtalis TaxID=35019 RepID=A0A6I9Y9Z9_9SAUR|nr:PREDICTED: solute carrier family 22 member 23-like [Thamnophis sirtalis]